MKKLLFLSFLAIIAASCTEKKSNTYKVSGEVNDSCEYVYYSADYMNSDGVDSVKVESGKFVIEGTIEQPSICLVQSVDGKAWTFFLEPGEIALGDDGKVSGTPLNEEYNVLDEKLKAGVTSAEEKEKIYSEFIEKHVGDIAGALAVGNMKYDVSTTAAKKYMEKLTPEAKELLWKLIPQSVFEKEEVTVNEGDMFIDFEAEYEGKVQKLSDYVGKGQYVLVDFWASWCGPCREEIPNLIKLYEQFADKGLVDLGVATWDEPENTLAAIEELGIKYPQIMNAQTAGSDAYGIQGIPQIILFGPDGKIVRNGLRGEQMVQTVSALFE